MPYFSGQVDALLGVFLSSPTWRVDRPRENARFYRFAAAMMQEIGQPDIREVRAALEEAARAWAADYEAEGGYSHLYRRERSMRKNSRRHAAVPPTRRANMPP